jgi:ABC-type sugar transport system permease subunit
MRMKMRHRLGGYLFVAPYLLLFAAFLLLPLLFGLGLSFTRYEMLSLQAATFAGLANYREALADTNFRWSLIFTALFVVMSVPLTVALALLLAVAIQSAPRRRQSFYRLCIFIPTMLTISVVGILWRWFYNGEFGLFNVYLGKLGLAVPWITSKYWAMPSIVLMTVWWTVGGPVVILLAGLKQIPPAYYEAAAIDGAVGSRRFFSITLPLLKPVLLFVTVLNVIGAFQVFGQTFIVTHGGPEQVTRVLVQYIYETAFNFYRMGYGAAMSWLLFVVILAFSLVQFRALRER